MNEQIDREKCVQGTCWNSVHEGYFSDPSVSARLVSKIGEIACESRPNTIVDLGGGTGFLLSSLRAAGLDAGVSLVNLDDSPVQLDAAKSPDFSCFLGSADSFSRCNIGPEESRYLFVMRSVLHYFGKDGLRPVLRHLRAQTRPGEFFVHQTASFSRPQDAAFLNSLYGMMRTGKWYPTVAFLCEALNLEGWEVVEICPALPLRLKSDDLTQRYSLDQADLRRIRDRLSRNARVPEDVFEKTDEGFSAFLHYWTYVCTPVGLDQTEEKKGRAIPPPRGSHPLSPTLGMFP
jgi:hypothetical protein